MHVVLTGNTTFKLANFRQGLIRHLIGAGHRVTILAPPDDYVDAVRAMGCDFIPLAMDRNGTSPLAEARLLASIFRRLSRARPDAVFGYTIKNNIYAGLGCRLLGIPFVANVTGLGPAFNGTGLLNRVVRLLYRVAFRRALRIFFQNTDDLAIFCDTGLVARDRVGLLPGSGVDLDQFEESPLPGGRKEVVFLLVARMLVDKGVGLFAEAAARVRRQFPQARFRLLGPLDPDSHSGIPRERIESWVAEGHVEYLGATRDVRPHLRDADCIVLPSWYREGTPRSLLEAGAIGRPLITTDMPGCRDLVEPGKNGFLVAPRSLDDLVSALVAFLELHAAARQAMGTASRGLVAAKYDEKIVIAAYAEILDGIAAARRGLP